MDDFGGRPMTQETTHYFGWENWWQLSYLWHCHRFHRSSDISWSDWGAIPNAWGYEEWLHCSFSLGTMHRLNGKGAGWCTSFLSRACLNLVTSFFWLRIIDDLKTRHESNNHWVVVDLPLWKILVSWDDYSKPPTRSNIFTEKTKIHQVSHHRSIHPAPLTWCSSLGEVPKDRVDHGLAFDDNGIRHVFFWPKGFQLYNLVKLVFPFFPCHTF